MGIKKAEDLGDIEGGLGKMGYWIRQREDGEFFALIISRFSAS
jgi:hypothetical protein